MLYDKYRPRDWNDVLGNPKAVKVLSTVTSKENFTGGAYWIDGASGTGKTTLAEIIAGKLAHPHNVFRLDGDKCDVSAVHRLEDETRCKPLGGRFRVIIVNEAHNDETARLEAVAAQ